MMDLSWRSNVGATMPNRLVRGPIQQTLLSFEKIKNVLTVNQVTQCDQMATLFFTLWPFTSLKIAQ